MENEKIKERIAYDYAKDVHQDNRTFKWLLLALTTILALLIVGIVVIVVSNQRSNERQTKMFLELMSQYDYETNIDVATDNNMFEAGNVRIQR